MSEETNQQPAVNNDVGSKPEANSPIEQARVLVERLEKANKRTEELISKHEQIIAKDILSGKAQAGAPIPTPQEEQTKAVQDMINAKVNKLFKRN